MGNFRSKYRHSWRTSSSNPEKSVFGGITPSSTLLNGLVSYWTMNEASGNRLNSISGQNPCVPTADAPTQTTGLIGNAAQCSTATPRRYFTVSATGSNIPTTGTRTWAYVAKWDNLSTQPGIFENNTSTNWYSLLLGGSNLIRSRITTNVTTYSVDSQAVILATGTWYIVRVWWSSDTNKLGVQVNDNAAVTVNTSGTPVWGATGWNIGNFGGVAHDGVLDDFGIWNRELTDAEWVELRAAWGGGTAYPF